MKDELPLVQMIQDIEEKKSVEFYYEDVNPQLTKIIYDLISSSLAIYDLHYLNDVVFALFLELINNAFKANLKRIYFLKNHISLDDKAQQAELMKDFRKKVLDQKELYLQPMKDSDLYCKIKINFVEKDSIDYEVINNSIMTQKEQEKVNARLKKAKEIKNLMEVYDNFSDDSEGAGLGLLMNLMLLKTSGIGPDNFFIQSNEKETVARLRVSKKIHRPQYVLDIENRIVSMIKELPVFPETVKKIQTMCEEDTASVSEIASEIEKDPSLSVSLLKLVRTGGFLKENSDANIAAAASVVGIKGIRNMMTGISIYDLMDNQYKVMKGFWDHSFKAAFYAKEFVEKLNLNIDSDSVYLAGLLHNIGKIVLASVDPQAIKEINGLIIDENRRSSSILEEITLGTSHTSIGEKMAQKWELGKHFIASIRFHHCPLCAPEEFRVLVSIIHVVNALLKKEQHKGKMVFIHSGALDFFNLNDPHRLESLHLDLQEKYNDYLMDSFL